MAAHHNFESMAAKLDDPNSGTKHLGFPGPPQDEHQNPANRNKHQLTCNYIDLRAKGAQAIDIRDNIESYCQGPQYSAFLNHLVPVFLKILEGEPVFISTSPDQVCLRALR